jgi:hypothetical protein
MAWVAVDRAVQAIERFGKTLLEREQLLQLHPKHLVARDLELAGKEELHPGGRALLQLLKVVGGDVDRAVGRLFALGDRRYLALMTLASSALRVRAAGNCSLKSLGISTGMDVSSGLS